MVSQNTHNRRAAANPPLRLIPENLRHAERSRFSGGAEHLPRAPAGPPKWLLRKTGARELSNFSITKLLNSTILPDL